MIKYVTEDGKELSKEAVEEIEKRKVKIVAKNISQKLYEELFNGAYMRPYGGRTRNEIEELIQNTILNN